MNAVTKGEIRDMFQGRLGRAITDKMLDKADEMWAAYYESLTAYRDDDDDTVTEKPGLPGYWKEDGNRVLHACIRNDAYTVEWGEHSRIEFALGKDLKDKYGLNRNERLRLPIKGSPRWDGKQGRLELGYDRRTDTFTAHRPMTFSADLLGHGSAQADSDHSSLADAATDGGNSAASAAVDIGANNLAAITTSHGHQRLYHGRPLFRRFRRTTQRIARLRSRLDEDTDTSTLIQNLYTRRSRRRNHAQDALVRQLAAWFAQLGVTDVYVGDLDDVCEKHWSAMVNEKTDLFWAHGQFRDRLNEVCEEYGIAVHEESEAGTSSRCPRCGEDDHVSRNADVFMCGRCAFEGHSDLVGSENFLHNHLDERDDNRESDSDSDAGPMARPAAHAQNRAGDAHRLASDSRENGHREVACFQWNDHEWRRSGRWDSRPETNEDSANRSTRMIAGKIASASGSA